MLETILGLLKPPAVVDGGDSEKPDYTLAIVGSIALIVVVVVIFVIFKRK